MSEDKKNTSRWVSWGSSGGHNGEYNYDCTICGKSDWIPHYGKVEDLRCDCTIKLKIIEENIPRLSDEEYIKKYNDGKVEIKDDKMKVTINNNIPPIIQFKDLKYGEVFEFNSQPGVVYIKINGNEYYNLETKEFDRLPNPSTGWIVNVLLIEKIELRKNNESYNQKSS